MKVIEQSHTTRLEAGYIIEDTGIISILKAFGDVRIGGSFYTGLMYGPDIDITVASKNPRRYAVEFLKLIIDKRIFHRVEYGDFEKFPRPDRRHDHIVVLVHPYLGRKWEIETWFVKQHYADQIELEEKLLALPDSIKLNILQAKADRDRKGIDKHSLSSYDIYQTFI